MLKLQQIVKDYQAGDTTVHALHGVSLQFRESEFVAILGHSGCGKTTILRMIAGLEHPTTGHIYLDDEDVTSLAPYKRNVNMVFQHYALFPHMTVEDNIRFGLMMKKVPKEEQDKRIDQVLYLTQLENLRYRKPQQMSGGQQQRVAIARALCMNPIILFFDEPTSALDPELTSEILKVIKDLAAEHITMVIVTHEMTFARDISDHIIFMDKGLIAVEGSPKEVFESEHARMKEFLGKFHQG